MVVFYIFCVLASYYDLKYKKIPNFLNLSFFIYTVLIYIIFKDLCFVSLIKAFFFSFFVFLPFYIFKIYRGGDYKMVLVLASYLSYSKSLDFILLSILFSGILSLIYIFIFNKYMKVFYNIRVWILTWLYPNINTQFPDASVSVKCPSALAIAIAAIIVYTNSWRIFIL